MILIEHKCKEPVHYGMIIPFGEYKNSNLVEASIGDICETMDKKNKFVEIVAKTIISSTSGVADTLSIMLYNREFEDVWNAMKRNWYGDIFEDQFLFLVVRRIKSMNTPEIEFRLMHKYSEEVFVPYAAISDNVRFFMEKNPKVITLDSKTADVLEKRSINVVSDEGMKIIWRLYQSNLETFLKAWLCKCPTMTSMGFCYMRLKSFVPPIIDVVIDKK